MLRYIKVNDQWIDTLEALKTERLVYMVIDSNVITIDDKNNEVYIGRLQGERDLWLTNRKKN